MKWKLRLYPGDVGVERALVKLQVPGVSSAMRSSIRFDVRAL